jgi:hypothetical protein
LPFANTFSIASSFGVTRAGSGKDHQHPHRLLAGDTTI